MKTSHLLFTLASVFGGAEAAQASAYSLVCGPETSLLTQDLPSAAGVGCVVLSGDGKSYVYGLEWRELNLTITGSSPRELTPRAASERQRPWEVVLTLAVEDLFKTQMISAILGTPEGEITLTKVDPFLMLKPGVYKESDIFLDFYGTNTAPIRHKFEKSVSLTLTNPESSVFDLRITRVTGTNAPFLYITGGSCVAGQALPVLVSPAVKFTNPASSCNLVLSYTTQRAAPYKGTTSPPPDEAHIELSYFDGVNKDRTVLIRIRGRQP